MAYPKIGLALGSGGARGLAHIGVLKVLTEEKIPIHLIAGSSIGALVGAFFAAGHSIDQLIKISRAFKKKYFLDFTIPKLGLISGNRIKEFIRIFTYNKNIEDLDLPLAVIATDVHTGEKVVFTSGPIHERVRASISIPGIFVPEMVEGRLLFDGGVSDRVPVSVAKEMGADFVIAIDVAGLKTNATISTIYDVILQSIDIMQKELVASRELQADVMIRPDVEMFNAYSFSHSEELIERGEIAARQALEKIRRGIEKWKESQK